MMSKRCVLATIGLAIVGVLSNNVQTVFYTGSNGLVGSISDGVFSMTCIVTTALCLLLSGIAALRWKNTLRLLPLLYLLITGAGLLMWLVGALFSSLNMGWLKVMVALGIGCGVAFGALYWFGQLRDEPDDVLIRCIVASPCLSAALGFITRSLGYSDARVLLLAALFLLSVVLVLETRESSPEIGLTRPESASARTDGGQLHGLLQRMWKEILFVAVFGFASGSMRTVEFPQEGIWYNLVVTGATLLGVLVFFVVTVKVPRGTDSLAYRTIALVGVSTAFLLLSFLGTGYWIFLFGLIDLFYETAFLHMNLSSVRIAKASFLPVATTLGVFKSALFLSVALGFGISRLLQSNGGAVGAVPVLASIALYLVAMGVVSMTVGRNVREEYDAAPAQEDVPRPAGVLLGVTEEAIRTNPQLTRKYGITEREMDVLLCALSGANAAGISKSLFISENTARSHLKKIYRKLDVHSKEELRAAVLDLLSAC